VRKKKRRGGGRGERKLVRSKSGGETEKKQTQLRLRFGVLEGGKGKRGTFAGAAGEDCHVDARERSLVRKTTHHTTEPLSTRSRGTAVRERKTLSQKRGRKLLLREGGGRREEAYLSRKREGQWIVKGEIERTAPGKNGR